MKTTTTIPSALALKFFARNKASFFQLGFAISLRKIFGRQTAISFNKLLTHVLTLHSPTGFK